MAQLEFDEELAQQLDEMYRTRDVIRRRRLVREALGAQAGERVLDVGCGPGFYVAELAEQVGPEGAVSGVDSSAAMLAVARKRCEELPNTDFAEADATALPFDATSFDAAVSVQVMEYVEDVEDALRELHRVVRPGGRVVLWDVDWRTISWHSADPERMHRILDVWDEHLADPALPRRLAPLLGAAGFADVEMEAHTFASTELSRDAYVGLLVGVMEPYAAQRGHADEVAAWAAEQRELDARGEFYCALVQVRFSARRA